MNIGIISLFPEMFETLNHSITGRAIEKKLLQLDYWHPRDFTCDKHRTVDDKPYGGGPGMLMKVQPLRDAIHAAKAQLGQTSKTIYLSPQGKPFNQEAAWQLAQQKNLIIVAGRYEGIDERLIETEIDEEWSIGNYVLTGGELPAMVMIDAITRLIPGVLGDENSAEQDSFAQGLLDHPHYTRPETFNEHTVPDVLLSGNHAAIDRWRKKQALGRTWLRRPDLLQHKTLSPTERTLLSEFIDESAEK